MPNPSKTPVIDAPSVADAALDQLIDTVLSRAIAEHRSKNFNRTGYLCHALWRYGITSTAESDAPCPWLQNSIGDPIERANRHRFGMASPCPHGDSVRAQLGLTPQQVWSMWATAKATYGLLAALPRDVIDRFVPRVFRPVVAAIVADGPGVAIERLERLLAKEAARRVAPTRARPNGGPISQGQVDNIGKALMRTMRSLVDLRLRRQQDVEAVLGKIRAEDARATEEAALGPTELLLARLAPWTALPSRIDWPTCANHVTDTSAPSIEVIRKPFHEVNDEIAAIFGCPLQEQLNAVDRLGAAQGQRLFYRLRRRLLLMLLFMTGGRIGALTSLNVGDYEPRRLCADGLYHPAIALRPGKTVDEQTIHWKPIPDAAGAVIETWLAFIEHRTGLQLVDSDPLLLSFLQPERAELGSDDVWRVDRKPVPPLITAALHERLRLLRASGGSSLRAGETLDDVPALFFWRRWSPHAIRATLGHTRRTTHRLKSGEARTYSLKPVLPRGEDGLGYTPHPVRAATQQAIRDWGRRYLTVAGIPASDLTLQLTFEALVDHKTPTADPLGYLGGSKPQGRERYSLLGTSIIWDVLAGASPRTTGDRESYEAAWIRRLALEAERDRLDSEFSAAEQALDVQDQQSVLSFGVTSQRISQRRAQITEALAAVHADMVDIRTNPTRRIPVSDDIAVVETVDFDQLDLRMKNGGTAARPRLRGRSVRDWVTPREFAYALTGERTNTGSTVRRWMDKGLPASRPYWDQGKPPIHEFSLKRRALVAQGINLTLLDDEQRGRVLDVLAQAQPEGWESYPARISRA